MERDAMKDTLSFFSPILTFVELQSSQTFPVPCLPGSVRENKRKDIPVDENDDRENVFEGSTSF